jgi:nucleotide-binding universal stress UspA family protein
MAVVDTQRRKAAAPALTPEAHARPTLRALAVVDGSAGAGRVIKYLIDLHRGGAPLDVVLLNIQPRPQEWRLRGYGWFARDAIHDRLINDLGRRIVASAARYLDSVGISHRDRIELGDRGETILRCVREEGCDLLVLADCRHRCDPAVARADGANLHRLGRMLRGRRCERPRCDRAARVAEASVFDP